MTNSWIEDQYKYCPRCASENSSPGMVPFKCEACGFASFFGPVAAVGGIVTNDPGELLLVRRARNPGKGKWGLPGGFVDRHESAEEALIREILEETCLIVTHTAYLMTSPNQYCYQEVIAPVIDLFYTCQVESTDEMQLAHDELEHFEWTQPNAEHLSNMAFESNRLAIEHWLKTSGR